jgi:cysteine desulfuration protein SufE
MKKELENRLLSLQKKFHLMTVADEKYAYLIELGRALPSYPQDCRTSDRIVPGCQSTLYLEAHMEEGKLFFQSSSDALISQGLAALLIHVYSGLPAEMILLNPPVFLHELGIFASLSPHRSNGLASIYTRMKQEALKFLIKQDREADLPLHR